MSVKALSLKGLSAVDQWTGQKGKLSIEKSFLQQQQQRRPSAQPQITRRSTRTSSMIVTQQPGQHDSLKRQFDLLDTDEDGTISSEHLSNVLRSMGLNVTDQEMANVMARTDIDGDGLITLNDFVTALSRSRAEERLQTPRERDAVLRSTWQIFDRSNLGLIGAREIWAVLTNLGKKFTLEEIEEVVAEVDDDGDGYISYAEFVQAMYEEEPASGAEENQQTVTDSSEQPADKPKSYRSYVPDCICV